MKFIKLQQPLASKGKCHWIATNKVIDNATVQGWSSGANDTPSRAMKLLRFVLVTTSTNAGCRATLDNRYQWF